MPSLPALRSLMLVMLLYMFHLADDIMSYIIPASQSLFDPLLSALLYAQPMLLVTQRILRRMTIPLFLTSHQRFPTSSRFRRKALRFRTFARSRCRTIYARSSRSGRPPRILSKQGDALPSVTLMCLASRIQSTGTDHSYDSDSYQLGIDNHASYSMTNNQADFIDTPVKVRVRIKGINGNVVSALRGTVKWSIEDDDGVSHTLIIPGTYYLPMLPLRLLSPQHLAQALRPQETMRDGTYCLTFANRLQMVWQDRKYTRTVPLTTANVGIIRSSPGYHRHHAFQAHCMATHIEPHLIPPDDDIYKRLISPADSTDEGDHDASSAVNASPSHSAMSPPPGNTPFCRPLDSAVPPDTPPDGNPDTSFPSETNGLTTDFSIYKPDTGPHIIPEEEPPDIGSPTKELLVMHYRLGHLPFARIQKMAKDGRLPSRLASCRVPECAACRFGRATKIPWRTKGNNNSGKLKEVTRPGQCVSVDQLESTTPGFIAQLKGRPTKNRYRYVTVFTDHFSRLSYVYLQKAITSDETVRAKRAFESYARTLGVSITHYHADNGRFADNAFLEDVSLNRQSITFCGVNAHFQNGISEKRIRDLQDLARTQLIHAQHRWPAAVEASLWPYAIRYANAVHNSSLTLKSTKSPIELFAGIKMKPGVKHFHPFGCPVYVLKNQPATNKSIPKWESKSRLGLYLGPSPRHSRSVALVLNLETGMVSPQYHVRYDNLFETLQSQRPPKILWQEKCHFRVQCQGKTSGQQKRTPTMKTSIRTTLSETDALDPSGEDLSPIDQSPNEGDESIPTTYVDPPVTAAGGDNVTEDSHSTASPSEGGTSNSNEGAVITTRSGRVSRAPAHHSDYVAYEALAQDMYIEEDSTAVLDDPIAFAMKASSDPDTLTYQEAMSAPDVAKFREAMVKEVMDHTKRQHWEVMLKSDLPEGDKPLPAVWAGKRKRRIATREIYKYKMRLNLGGHKMIPGKHFDQTYAPSLSWPTILTFLVLANIHGWACRQADFVLAYPQARAPRPTFMELPKGVKFPGLDRNKHCLRIKRNLYGGKDAGRTWYLHLKKGMESLGYDTATHDRCVFIKGTTIVLVYTDDCILFDTAGQQTNIDKALKEMQTIFDIEDEGELEEYLGVKIQHHDDGRIEFTQPQLIDSILIDLGLLASDGSERPNTSTKDTPLMTSRVLGPDRDGPAFDYTWEYRSVIGKLNFLEKSTRPDLAYATHQCARFMADPKKSHGEAIKHIGRYLLKTRDKGFIIKPDKTQAFECWVDADFCGNWDKDIAPTEPDTAKSRHGFVVKLHGAPICWASKLQVQYSLSTAESEFQGISAATRYVKSLMYLYEEISQKVVGVPSIPTMHCRLFEDNLSALEMAKIPKFRPRTRHINVIYHHFANEVANKRILLQAIGTHYQQADYLTKPCDTATFERHRKSVQGW